MQRSVKWRLIIIAIILAFSLFSLYPTLRWATLSDARKAELAYQWETQAKELREDVKWNRLTPKEQLADISREVAPMGEAYESGAIDDKFWERIKEGKLDSIPEEDKEEFVTLCGKLTGKDLTLKSSSKDIDKAVAAIRSVQGKLDKTFWNWVKKPRWEQLSESERQRYREIVQALTDWRIPRKPSVGRNVANWFRRWWIGDESLVISLGLDLKGGSYFVLQVEKPRGVSLADAAEGAIRVLQDRINRTGVREPIIQRQGSNRIIVQLPGLTDISRQRRLIERQAVMSWMLVDEPRLRLAQFSEDRLVRLYDRTLEELRKEMGLGPMEEPPTSALRERLRDFIPPDTILRIYEQETRSPGGGRVMRRMPLLLQEPEVIAGSEVARAMATRSSDTGQPIISFALSGGGARTFGRVTAQYNATTKAGKEYGGWRLAILLDDKVISAPHIKSEILGGSGQIEGDFTPEEARDLAIQLKAGALPAKLNIVEQNTVGPTLGADTVRKGVFAAILGLALVVVFMLVYYLGAGLIANLALVSNMVIILGVMAALHATLTLPGIAGIILTIGMAVDANVLINERIREELAGGKKIGAAIDAGYRKAFLTIFDSNLTTFICGVVLYYLGTGPVRGFAVTLIIGLATSMFTAIVVTRVVFDLLLRSKRFQRLPMLSIVRKPKYDFVAQMRKAVTVSIIVIVAGIICFGAKWSKNFGIDFTSGQSATVVFQNEVTTGQLARVRSALASSPDIEDFNLRRYRLQGEATHRGVAVDGKLVSGSESKPFDQRIIEVLSKENPRDTKIEPTVAKVYPVVAEHLWKQALIAVFVSLLAMLVYIWWRFEFRFALGGVIALLHDVLVTVAFMTGFFILTRRQINLSVIAAILTIIGYSINDTIVIFDRIREDMKMMKGVSLRSIINTAVNQTLSRTILTSTTTLLAILAIFLFGGQAINDFAFAMLVGCISGVYSTVFIASPIALLLEKTRSREAD